MPVNVDIADIKGPEGERARRLYAVPANATPKAKPKRRRSAEQMRIDKARARTAEARAAKAERPAQSDARARVKARDRAIADLKKNAAAGRSRRNSTIRRGFRHTARASRTIHRAAGSPGGTVAAMIGLFVGGGIVVALVKNPQIITAPLNFIAAAVKAFTGLLGGTGGTAPAHPIQNVAPKG